MNKEMISVAWLHGYLSEETKEDVSEIFDDLWEHGKSESIITMESTDDNLKKAYEIRDSFRNIICGRYAEVYYIDIFLVDGDGDYVKNECFSMSNELEVLSL